MDATTPLPPAAPLAPAMRAPRLPSRRALVNLFWDILGFGILAVGFLIPVAGVIYALATR